MEAETCFRQAIDIARRQSAKSLELRAVMSLCRLWQKQGKKEEARQMLEEVYGWFTEGFDMADLREAKELLEGISLRQYDRAQIRDTDVNFSLRSVYFYLKSVPNKVVMRTIEIDLPDEIFLSLKETPEGLSREIRMAAATKLYELGKLSSGRAAELAGVSRVSFLQALARYGVPIFDLTREELEEDLRNA